MTTQLTCALGHIIHVKWALPHAQFQVQTDGTVQLIVTDKKCQITCEGATPLNERLVCLTCGSCVHAPAIESLLRARRSVQSHPSDETAGSQPAEADNLSG